MLHHTHLIARVRARASPRAPNPTVEMPRLGTTLYQV
jgi:hypothetical protein